MLRKRGADSDLKDAPELVLFQLREILWPHGGYEDHQWTASEIEYVAQTLIVQGYGPHTIADAEGEARYDNGEPY